MSRCDSTHELQMWQLQLEVAGKYLRQPHKLVSEPTRGFLRQKDELCRGVEGRKGVTSVSRQTNEKSDKRKSCRRLTGNSVKGVKT